MDTTGIINILKKYRFFILAGVVIIILVVVLCLLFTGKIHLEQEFSLSVGKSASIAGEDLRLTFEEVLQDNRCPIGAECITEGAVVCRLEVKSGEAVYYIELAQPGLYYDFSQETFGDYKYDFKVEPYPEVDRDIAEDDYHLLLILENVAQEDINPSTYFDMP
jgi:hypothetical protein